ncbi:MAG TPA: hypothetical protein DCK76_12400 [Desulfotomaculum sp.]|nr:MAG: Serine/threonine-protein kinase-like domain protein [Desulfotomaculum sp. 46_80]KUK85210.1 MAG: Serine/threonine-protein kinase-like domain protein [Desulfofundulus kuznetsovii]HAG12133.1 hypothetical protein [Desulfotomaculum sp.]HBY03286.1 hypothetical protein [Desulfotomaculum sp.]
MYALKALFNNAEESPDFPPYFHLEKEILERITCRGTPRFVESFSLEDVYCIVQEYIPGWPLSYSIDTGCRFSEQEVRDILIKLFAILTELHCPLVKENAVIHRDIRLSNLLLNKGKLYLVDFGLARFLDPLQFPLCHDPVEITSTEKALKYVRPFHSVRMKGQNIPGYETYSLLRGEISPRSDLFGAGVVAVDLFINHVEDETQFELPWEKVLNLSDSFISLIKRLLSRSDGFETSIEALECLESLPGQKHTFFNIIADNIPPIK